MANEIVLTPEQLDIINYRESCFILAKAGAAKTSTVILKINKILQEQPGCNILYITFTRKAKEEAIEKIRLNRGVRVTNFHGLAYGILNHHKDVLQLDNIDIVPDSYEINILSQLFPTDKSQDTHDKLDMINNLKENYVKIEEMKPNQKAVYSPFQRIMNANKKYSYSDLVYKFNQIIENRQLKPYVKKMALTFDYIFVDEVQDTNKSQYVMIEHLMRLNPASKIQLVGDTDQSIFRFRSAQPELVLDFIDKYSPKLFPLSKNFRCQETVVDFGNIFLENCTEYSQLRKGLMTPFKGRGETVKWLYFETPVEQHSYICKTIHDMVANGECKYSDVTILFRMNRSGAYFEKTAIKEKLPLKLIRGSLMNRAEVKYLISLIRIGDSLNKETPNDDELTTQIAILAEELAADIGDESFKLVSRFKSEMSFYEKLKNISDLDIPGLGPKRKAGFTTFYSKLKQVADAYSQIKTNGINSFLDFCTDTILEFKFAKKTTKMSFDLIKETLKDICDIILDINAENLMGGIGTFMVEYSGEEKQDNPNKVIAMTVHKAKGTENKVVFIMDFTDFPASFSDDKEEEKRLLYVAVTRAKEKLYLTSTGYRFIYLDKIKNFKYLETNVPLNSINPEEDFYGNRKFQTSM